MQNITSATTTTLIEKEKGNGNVGSMRIVNNHSGDSQISVWITDDTTDFYLIKKFINVIKQPLCSFLVYIIR